MIDSITLENFRGFSGRHRIPLGKLTLLYGENSAGKSSVLYALRHMARFPDDRVSSLYSIPFYRRINRGATFESTVFNHETNLHIGLGFEVRKRRPFLKTFGPKRGWMMRYVQSDNGYGHMINNVLSEIELTIPGRDPGLSLRFSAEDRMRESDTHPLKLKRPGTHDASGPWKKLRELNYDPDMYGDIGGAVEFKALNIDSIVHLAADRKTYAEMGHRTRQIPPLSAQARLKLEKIVRDTCWYVQPESRHEELSPSFYCVIDERSVVEQFPEGPEEIFQALVNLKEIPVVWDGHLGDLAYPAYFGPARAQPARYMVRNDQWEVEDLDQAMRFPYRFVSQAECNQTNFWLRRLGTPYVLRIQTTGNKFTGPIDTPILHNRSSGIDHTLADVGFGFSQLLPLLAAGAIGGPLVYVEQPEIHLHPRLQASLADFFIESATGLPMHMQEPEPSLDDDLAEPQRPSDPCQWIIETHSEALMLRIQRRIREGRLSPDDVCVVYIGNIEGVGSVAKPLRLDEKGAFIDEWPGGFFEEDFDDVFGTDLQ